MLAPPHPARILRVASFLLLAGLAPASAAPTPAGRGADLPFVTHEAEAATLGGGARVVRLKGPLAADDSSPEMEASGRAFVELTRQGDHLEVRVGRAANTLVLRHCIPDAPGGGGISRRVQILVNGRLRQELELSSKHTWLYGAPGKNGQRNDPRSGGAHHYWDEARCFITGGLAAGDVLRIVKADRPDATAFVRVDLLDLEQVAPPSAQPADSLSVERFGAKGHDEADDTAAIAACIAAARKQGKSVWLPPGTYHQSAIWRLDGAVEVRGAGMWHTRIVGTKTSDSFAGNVGFVLSGEGPRVADLHIESRVHDSRRVPGGRAFTSDPGAVVSKWSVENVWITHTVAGFWMSGARDGAVRGCRVRGTYADAININNGARDVVVEQCHVRGSGDDSLAILSEEKWPATERVTLRRNTVSAPWWAQGIDIAGGKDLLVEDNLVADSGQMAGLTICMPGGYPMRPMESAIIRRNTLLRCGGNHEGQKRGAVWIFVTVGSIDRVVFEENEIVASMWRGIHLTGNKPQNIEFIRNKIVDTPEHAVMIEKSVTGAGVFRDNVVTGTVRKFVAPLNQAGDRYTMTGTGNSWR
jgi:hypothetical protein